VSSCKRRKEVTCVIGAWRTAVVYFERKRGTAGEVLACECIEMCGSSLVGTDRRGHTARKYPIKPPACFLCGFRVEIVGFGGE